MILDAMEPRAPSASPSVDNEPRARRLLVLGLGNPIRHDDAVGLEIVERARETLGGEALGSAVEWQTLCAGGFDLLYEVVGYDDLIIVDSLFTDTTVAGRVRVMSPAELGGGNAATVSPHLLSLPEALRWGAEVGYHVPTLHGAVVVEVDDRCMEFGEGLCEQVRAAIPEAAGTLCRMVRELVRQGAGTTTHRGAST